MNEDRDDGPIDHPGDLVPCEFFRPEKGISLECVKGTRMSRKGRRLLIVRRKCPGPGDCIDYVPRRHTLDAYFRE